MLLERILKFSNFNLTNSWLGKFFSKINFHLYYYHEYLYLSLNSFQITYYFWKSANYADFYWFLYIRELPTFSTNKTK